MRIATIALALFLLLVSAAAAADHIRPDGFGGLRHSDGTTNRPDGFGGWRHSDGTI